MEVELRAGAKLNLLSPDELQDGLAAQTDREIRELARGMKHLDFPVLQGAFDSNGNLTLGDPSTAASGNPEWCGPDQGFAWRVTRLSLKGMEAETADVYKGVVNDRRFVTKVPGVGVAAADDQMVLFGQGLILMPSQYIVVRITGGTTGNVVTMTAEGWEVPAEMMWKLS